MKKIVSFFLVICIVSLLLIPIVVVNTTSIQNKGVEKKAYSYLEPYIPKNFSHVEGTNVNNGYVIKNIKTGDEFVWIPVDGTNVKLERKDFSVSDLNIGGCQDIKNMEFEQSVKTYGGFYIARYEAGIPEGETYSGEEKNVTGKPVSKKSKEVWNYINYENAEASATEMYAEYSEITSSLTSSVAWDTVLSWLGKNGYNVSTDSHTWGNYTNNEYSTNQIAKTGYEKWVAKNIYDLAGNVAEWTTETANGKAVRRGGHFYNGGNEAPAGMRESQSKAQFNNTTGFRVMIYKTGEQFIEGYDDPYVPDGFEHTTGSWNNGFVIRDKSNGNEFVWVPVDGNTVNLKRMDFGTGFEGIKNATDALDNQFKISVYNNGGFYIARYESGQGTSETGQTLQGEIEGKPVSKKGVNVWTNISQEQAKVNSTLMYQKHYNMKSSLMSSYALDMTLQWLKNSGINVEADSSSWGNYSTDSTKSTLALTGANENYKANNIYDLAGNVWELTTEKYNKGSDVIVRGGDYLSTGTALPAGVRDIAKSNDVYNYMGYRTIIYKVTKAEFADIPIEWDASKVYAIKDEEDEIIPIPRDFYYVKGSKNSGVVISDNQVDENQSSLQDSELQGNQFVWIPVDNIDYFTRRAFGNTLVDITLTEPTSGKYWENVPDDLYASVSRYKGFYIARYEASYASGSSANDYIPSSKVSTSTTGDLIAGRLWNSINFANCKAASENMYKDRNNIKSTLTYSSQWDTMLQWIIDSGEKTESEVITDSTSWGNYKTSSIIGNDGNILKAGNTSTLLNTGITEYTIANNIYDLAGNLEEYVMEGYDSIYHACRGNYYSSTSGKLNASSRENREGTNANRGFRPSLYITMDPNEISIVPDVTTKRNTSFVGDNNGIEAGPITVTITYGATTLQNSDKFQYKISDGEWQISDSSVKLLSITENCTIYARYYTGQAGYKTISYNIENVDNEAPLDFEIDVMNATEIGLVIKAETEDVLSNVTYYEYELNDVVYKINKDDHKKYYTVTNINPGTTYKIKVNVYDEAGNKVISTNTKTVTTWSPTVYAWNVEKNVNKPEMTDGMIPIKFNGENWVTTTANDPEWYDYIESGSYYESKWANVMLSDGTYKYDTVEPGTVVQENELGSMFVWVPRYAYKIESGYHSSTQGEISIEFLEGTSSHKAGVDIVSYPEYNYSSTASKSKMVNYVVHPAFNYDEVQLTGIWASKFFASREDATDSNVGSSNTFKIIPEKKACSNISIGDAYDACIGINDSGNIYGLNFNDNVVDPHLLKNVEWGAITYLSHSKYGLNRKKIGYTSSYITGKSYSDSLGYSGTKNIYGIYDLLGFDHFVAAYINNGSSNLNNYASSLLNAPRKHKDVYENSEKDTSLTNLSKTKEKYGDAIYETSNGNWLSWYDGYADFPNQSISIMIRRGTYMNVTVNDTSVSTSMFASDGSSGQNNRDFRPIIVVMDNQPQANIKINANVTTPRNTQITGDNNGVPAGPITVTIDYGNTTLQKQYKEGVDGTWTTVSNETKQLSITSNKTIYARYFDGTSGYKTVSYTVSNVDNDKPNEFTAVSNYVDGMGIEISGYAKDNNTENVTYKYYVDNILKGTSKEKNYIVNIDTSTAHTAYIIALDDAGNARQSSSINITAGTTQNSKWNDVNKVNKPELTEGMIPIKYNGTNWVTTTADDVEWYDYKEAGTEYESKWANVMLSDGTYKYNTVSSGTVVQDSELGSMFVWIPRYAYKIESGYHTATTGEISIEFLEGSSSNKTGVDIGSLPEYNYSTAASESKMNNYVVHPGFNYDEAQLTGIWVGKYFASKDDSTKTSGGSSNILQVKGDKYAWNSINVGNAYTACIDMNNIGNSFELSTNDDKVDPHLIKNSEIGAVTYLTHSKYGVNKKEISISSYNGYVTGDSSYSGYKSMTCTKNIYGIFDLSGKEQIVSAYVNNGNDNLSKNGSSLISAPNKHKNVYKVSKSNKVTSYELNNVIYGDGIYEVSSNTGGYKNSWLEGEVYFPYDTSCFFIRGRRGSSSNSYSWSMFALCGSNGAASTSKFFRPTIAVINQ